jgi:tripartite-type tricarboxylate transporter receptor subunit TctC
MLGEFALVSFFHNDKELIHMNNPRQQHSRLFCAIGVALVTLVCANQASADDAFPSKPVTLVVPFPPGGSNDTFARLIVKDLGIRLKQQVIIDYRPGAGGNLGAGMVARAKADGYTLLAVSSTIVTNAASQSNLPFDVIKSFTPVALMATGPLVVAVNKNFPANTPAELVSVIRKNPGKYNYASAGPGSLNQFSTELLKADAGDLKITHVPYRGTGPALTDLIGNRTQMLIASAPALMPMVRSGMVKAIGITSLKPSPVAQELTPVATAVPGYEFESWWGVLAPTGTPAAVISQLNAAINDVVRQPAMQKDFLTAGAIAAPGAPSKFAATISRDLAVWTKIAKQQHIVAG